MTNKQGTATKTNRRLVGYFGVDTGQCVIGDPFFLKRLLTPPWDDIYPTFDNTNAEQLSDASGLELAVRVDTGMGDGVYPVYVETFQDLMGCERIGAMHIEFLPQSPTTEEVIN
jgi:hypothetical protein